MEVGLISLQDSFSHMELGMIDKFYHLEDVINKLIGALVVKQAPSLSVVDKHNGNFSNNHSRKSNISENARKDNKGKRPMFYQNWLNWTFLNSLEMTLHNSSQK